MLRFFLTLPLRWQSTCHLAARQEVRCTHTDNKGNQSLEHILISLKLINTLYIFAFPNLVEHHEYLLEAVDLLVAQLHGVLVLYRKQTSAPIGAWKCNFPPFLTDRPTGIAQ